MAPGPPDTSIYTVLRNSLPEAVQVNNRSCKTSGTCT